MLLPEVLAECVFVLESFYKHPRDQIARALRDLISSPESRSNRWSYTERLDRTGMASCTSWTAPSRPLQVLSRMPIATFDAGLKKLGDVEVIVD